MPTTELEVLSKNLSHKLTGLYAKLPTEPVNKKLLYSEIVSFFNGLPGVINLINGKITGKVFSFVLNKINLPKWLTILGKRQSEYAGISTNLRIIYEAFNLGSTHPVEKEIAREIINFLAQLNTDQTLGEIFTYIDKFWVNIQPVIEQILIPAILPKDSTENKNNLALINSIFEVIIPSCESKDAINREKQKEALTNLLTLLNNKLLAADYPKILTTIIPAFTTDILNSEISDCSKGQILRIIQQLFNQILTERKIKRDLILSPEHIPYLIQGIKLVLSPSIPILNQLIELKKESLEEITHQHTQAHAKLAALITGAAKEIFLKKFETLPIKPIIKFRESLNLDVNDDNEYATALKIKYDFLISHLDELQTSARDNNIDLNKLNLKIKTIITQLNSLVDHIQSNATETNYEYRFFIKKGIAAHLKAFFNLGNGDTLWSINNEFNITNQLINIKDELLSLQIQLEQQVIKHQEILHIDNDIINLQNTIQQHLKSWSTTSMANTQSSMHENYTSDKPRSLYTILALKIIFYIINYIKNSMTSLRERFTNLIKNFLANKPLSKTAISSMESKPDINTPPPAVVTPELTGLHAVQPINPSVPIIVPPSRKNTPIRPPAVATPGLTKLAKSHVVESIKPSEPITIVINKKTDTSPSRERTPITDPSATASTVAVSPSTPSTTVITSPRPVPPSTPIPQSAPIAAEPTYDDKTIKKLTAEIKKIDSSNIINFRKSLNTSNNDGADACKEAEHVDAFTRSKIKADILKSKYDSIINDLECSNTSVIQNFEQILLKINNLIIFIETIINEPTENEQFRLFVKRTLREDLGFSNRKNGGARLSTINSDFDLIADLQKLQKQMNKVLPTLQTPKTQPQLKR